MHIVSETLIVASLQNMGDRFHFPAFRRCPRTGISRNARDERASIFEIRKPVSRGDLSYPAVSDQQARQVSHLAIDSATWRTQTSFLRVG